MAHQARFFFIFRQVEFKIEINYQRKLFAQTIIVFVCFFFEQLKSALIAWYFCVVQIISCCSKIHQIFQICRFLKIKTFNRDANIGIKCDNKLLPYSASQPLSLESQQALKIETKLNLKFQEMLNLSKVSQHVGLERLAILNANKISQIYW